MKTLLLINLEGLKESDLTDFRTRVAARAVVFDSENKIALLHSTKYDYYKLPGGGVEGGEYIKTGLEREVEEEVGCDIEVSKEIGKVVEWRGEQKLIQESFNFIAKVVGDKRNTRFTDKEIEEGLELVWVDFGEAVKLVKGYKSDHYVAKYMTTRDYTILNNAKEMLI